VQHSAAIPLALQYSTFDVPQAKLDIPQCDYMYCQLANADK
jgi:hypothetical protein